VVLTLEQQVGALFMLHAPVEALSLTTLELVRDRYVGGVFFAGRSLAGVGAIARLVASYRLAARTPGSLFFATDQEGGYVQVLRGAGFSDLPSAVSQARCGGSLLANATIWGRELYHAGINVNLAPVADLVDTIPAADNAPIGYFDRHYGQTPASVIAGAGAFAAGMQTAGVIPTLKHFPGLGRVAANTDKATNVVDNYTSVNDVSIKVFTDLISYLSPQQPAPWVMMSTAIYPNLDPINPAAFSPAAIGILRDAGFNGVVITDDLSKAKQVSRYSLSERAVKAISAGVDIMLFSATAKDVPAAMAAVLAKAKTDPTFAARVAESAHRVTRAQAALSLA